MSNKVTIYTIAKEAGVSVSTVSRFLTGSANIQEEKRRRIEETIKKYNYKPSVIARSLSNQETKMIGFILPDVTHPFYGTVFVEAEKYAMELGYTILLCNTINDNMLNNTHMEENYIGILCQKMVDGVIMMGGHINETKVEPGYLQKLIKLIESVPVVMINGEIEGLDCYRIITKDEVGIRAMINYLVSLKHTKIGFIGGVLGIQPTEKRLKAIKEAMTAKGLEFNDEWFIESGFDINAGICAFEKLLQMNDRPTAIACINDLVAIGAIYTATRFGLKIPQDMSIVGFDNIYLNEYMIPRITTVGINLKEVGKYAVDILYQRLNGKNPEKVIELETQLVIRDSCIIAKSEKEL
ncbi:MAG: LacI family DNA-binding transcriptional regulator [Firmicutes bacterium]|nr:LacI family DNA-binding transcriptional regulator [Bacillota bacterium]